MGTVSVVIVDYGTLERTKRFIDDFLAAIIFQGEINFIIVDNWDKWDADKQKCNMGFSDSGKEYHYRDGSTAKIWTVNHKTQKIYLLDSGRNNGYAKGNNLGAMFSKDILNTDYVIFSNNDIQFPQKIDFKNICDVFNKYADCFAVGPKIIGIDKKLQGPVRREDSYFQALIYPYSIFRIACLFWHSANSMFYDNIVGIVHHTVGCFLIVNLDKFISIGLFDEHTFLYYEEDILSERGKKKNLFFYFQPGIEIIHEGGSTTKKLPSLEQKKIFFRSGVYYYQEYRNISKLKILLAKANFYLFYVPLYWGLQCGEKLLKRIK